MSEQPTERGWLGRSQRHVANNVSLDGRWEVQRNEAHRWLGKTAPRTSLGAEYVAKYPKKPE